jgi:hypothetical protein
MRHVHPLRFDALEARKLLSRAHIAVTHHPAAAVATPLVLSGTLAVNNNAASTTMNPDGSSTTSIPVAGKLGALGEVRGVWNETVDSFGNISGPDTLRLHDPKGTLVIAISAQNSGRARLVGHGAVAYQRAQRFYGGTGAYAHGSESGSVELITNDAKSHVVSLVFDTQNP